MPSRLCPTKNNCVHRLIRGQLGLRACVQDYINECRALARVELGYYAHQPTLRATIELAARCIDSGGSRSSHQHRRSQSTLDAARDVLTAASHQLCQCSSFTQLHETVDRLIAHIPDLGELYSYDTALHIGAKLGLTPDVVYLHCGTRDGARNLGLPHRRRTLDLDCLRSELLTLAPYEIEDFLCIYKSFLSEGMP